MKITAKIIYFLALIALFSCQKMDKGEECSEICFTAGYSVSVVKDPTKVALFHTNDDIHNKGAYGGFFNVNAYKSGTETAHFTVPATVMYHTDTQTPDWKFYNPSSNSFESRYWPQTYKLDFLAYMPLKRPDSGSGTITQEIDPHCHISGFGYDKESSVKGPTIICGGLPTDKEGQESAKEFIYAYTPEQGPETAALNSNKVPLVFQHCYAVVSVKIIGAHGGTTINSLGFSNIFNSGTFNVANGVWTPTGTRTSLDILVDQTIPTDIQIGHVFGPYVVLPQLHTGPEPVSFFIHFTDLSDEKTGTDILSAQWEAGKKYTYSVTLGNERENVIVDLKIEPWLPSGSQEVEIK